MVTIIINKIHDFHSSVINSPDLRCNFYRFLLYYPFFRNAYFNYSYDF